MEARDNTLIRDENGESGSHRLVSSPSLELDAGDYMADLADFDMTEPQKIVLLQTLWSIMGSFARMGFEVDVCGLIFDEFNEVSAPESGNGKLTASTIKEASSKDRGEKGTHD